MEGYSFKQEKKEKEKKRTEFVTLNTIKGEKKIYGRTQALQKDHNFSIA